FPALSHAGVVYAGCCGCLPAAGTFVCAVRGVGAVGGAHLDVVSERITAAEEFKKVEAAHGRRGGCAGHDGDYGISHEGYGSGAESVGEEEAGSNAGVA